MRHTLVCTVLLIVAIVIGYQIDSLQYSLRNYASQTFDGYVLVFNRMPWVVSAVYIVVGLMAASFPLWFFGLRIQSLPFNVTPLAQSLTSHMGQMGAFSAIMGLAGAILTIRKRRLASVA